MVPFGGWEMPLSYSEGTLAEHGACRAGAVAFDVSHLGTVRVTGPGARDRLQWALTNDLDRIDPGRAQYTHLLDPDDASVLDDIIVWWRDTDHFDVMPNASNTDRVTEAFTTGTDGDDGTEVLDVTATRAVIAIQGPEARDRLGEVAPDAAAIGRFRVGRFEWEGSDCAVAGTGYTGEPGLECAVPNDVAGSFWDAVVGAGIPPAGLGARDTLRLEAGLPLHGHELGPGITPLQAGLGWVVGWDKPVFRGREPLLAEQEAGIPRLLRGLSVEGRRPPREGQPVLRDGVTVATVTSGNFSPVLGHGIAMAFLEPDSAPGDAYQIDMRGTGVPAAVVDLPFLQ
jgi:aminomethyltransferase